MTSFRNKKHLFFDLDDTLWDFQSNSARVLEELYYENNLESKLGHDFSSFLSEYKKVNFEFWSRYSKGLIDKSHLRNKRFEETFKRLGYENETEHNKLSEAYISRAPKGKALKPGCIEVLKALKQVYNLHLLTNGFLEVQHIKIDNCGLRPYFNRIIVSEEHALSKPDQRIFRLAEKLSGAETSECIMIGDNYESDIAGAVGAGWDAIHLSEEKSQHINSIHHLSELLLVF